MHNIQQTVVSAINKSESFKFFCFHYGVFSPAHQNWGGYRKKKVVIDAHLPLEVEEAQGLELHCGFSSQIRGQRTWQALQLLDPVCNSSLESERYERSLNMAEVTIFPNSLQQRSPKLCRILKLFHSLMNPGVLLCH